MCKSLENDYNRDGLDTDLLYIYFNDGRRTPQNDKEREIVKELEEIKKRGKGLELNFD